MYKLQHKKYIKYSQQLFTIKKYYKIKEIDITKTYANLYKNKPQIKNNLKNSTSTTKYSKKVNWDNLLKKKRGYIKRMVRLRYRWYYRPELEQFKAFRKFFRKTFTRYKKIQKNKLFITKFRKNFSKLTGFNEKFIYKKWLAFRRNYNQYWMATNALLKFSQQLLMAPYALLVSIKIAPSLSASKHLINCGFVSVNGTVSTIFSNFLPGDILQINMQIFINRKTFFSYQQQQNFCDIKNTFPFMYIDWSSMLFLMIRWPKNYELIAPKFLTEKWIRYYVHFFPVKAAKFKTVRFNTKIYKTIRTKNLTE